MLLERLVSYAREHRGTVPAFHRDREFRWKLDVSATARGIDSVPTLVPLKDPDKPRRGIVHTTPSSTRTVGVSPNLAADDAQYVFGWIDDNTDQARAQQCHEAFVQLIHEWAESVPTEIDPVPHTLSALFRSGLLASLEQPEELRAKDGVLITVNGVPAYRSVSAADYWRTHVGTKKGTGRTGACMICQQVRPLANTIPGKVPAPLVPGASNDAALVSINERVFGYDLEAQLTHTPICMGCADDLMVGLTTVLSSSSSLTLSGQDTRLAWWVSGSDESDWMDLLLEPDPDQVNQLFLDVHRGRERTSRLTGRFCWMAVGGNISRIMVRQWVDIALTCADDSAVSHDENVLAWFRDHKNTPRRTAPIRRSDGTEIPAGQWIHSPGRFAACLGRWDGATKQYRPFGAKNADRPEQALLQLLRVAVLNEPVPVAIQTHLIHRIRNDGRVDDCRASLIRLALTRSPARPKDTSIPMALDETCTDPAYLAGRLFAVLEQTQRAAHRAPRARSADSGSLNSGDDGQPENSNRSPVNSTYGDRYFRRAIETPQPVVLQGIKQSQAWLTKIRRRDGEARSQWYSNRIRAIVDPMTPSAWIPLRNNLWQQGQFVLGYNHQLAHRTMGENAETV
ncbi:type I-C CRISPR-associated protein Cas8c/Csd1 [Nocardia huaxiensis]|uniref:Type I-C CRISPR-associated protein Cas8c/Csd1 n=1 Tax=Nocardia huaxiensis TaxID=2755382 RepID=A0A7D6ZS26_9NOCA|nr:type I-C CRISPR-associated protein Cas8c/Csd1 [Nocardia huaxiensis]QLY33943.1 type I-C CRISPR-associated protein Cas8c/Csd1 [Nocardia huaxiensis]